MKLKPDSDLKILGARNDSDLEYYAITAMPMDLGITGSTFRAYIKCKSSPSQVYRSWVNLHGYNLINSFSVSSREDFLSLHNSLAKSLASHWESLGNRDLIVSEKFKLIDLFIKAIAFKNSHPCVDSRESLYKYGNIPLDKFSLLAIRDLWFGIVISRNPSMGDIVDTETYDYLQSVIFNATNNLGVPNLVFDYYAWNAQH